MIWIFSSCGDSPIDDPTDAKAVSCLLEELLLDAAVD